jgi:hypothetical protein
MKYVVFIFSLSFVFHLSTTAQVGKMFPAMNCSNLNDASVVLPTGLAGKKSVLCLAYSQKAQEKLQGWLSEAIPKFVLRGSDNSMIPLEPYNVNTYFIAMYTGANKLAAKNASTQIKTNVDALLHSYVLIYAGDLEPYKTTLQMINKDDPYIFVLDPKGKVEYSYGGAYSAKVMDEIESLIADEE